jgi:membrane glycosyltransferase
MQHSTPASTPTGLQSLDLLNRRRRIVAALCAALYFGLVGTLFAILADAGPLGLAIVLAFAFVVPWTVLGIVNALLGFWLAHIRDNGHEEAAPFLLAAFSGRKIASRTAVLMTIRNEEPARAFARLRATKASLDETGQGANFDWFVLSDTSDSEIARREEEVFAAWQAENADGARLHYRRRSSNEGYKAGNIQDFCERFGADFEFMIPLDADSLMDGETISRLVRVGEAHPMLGILQSLVVGAPSRSAFARLFQFGMRHGMRSYTLGATWWAGDCGPYWGHNALVRIAPFLRHCRLPKLEKDRPILSHDQVEAVLMRRAGYEVRVMPIEQGSYEDNPPSLTEFVRRDLRWCQGNMQYWPLLRLPGLLPMSRFQLVWAISMFAGAPAWCLITVLGALLPWLEPQAHLPGLLPFYLAFLLFQMLPKLAGLVDVALTPGEMLRYGGPSRFLAGAFAEMLASFLIGAVTSFSVTLFLARLALGQGSGWRSQNRDPARLAWREAATLFWPHLAYGACVLTVAGAASTKLLFWALPITAGTILAIPFAVFSASPRLGETFVRQGLCATPEDVVTPPILEQPAEDFVLSLRS